MPSATNIVQRWAGRLLHGGPGRFILAAAAVLFAAAAVVVHFLRAGTSVTVISAAERALAKTTTVHAAGSDSLQLGLLGFAAVFALAAVFYPRLSSISLPGGIGIKLSPEQRQQATAATGRAVARAVARRAALVPAPAGAADHAAPAPAGAAGHPAPAPSGAPAAPAQPRMLQLSMMAAASSPAPPDQVVQASQDAAEGVAQATQHTTEYAEAMLRLTHTSPEGLRAVAESLGIPPEDWGQVLTGKIPDRVWDKLADRALDQAG